MSTSSSEESPDRLDANGPDLRKESILTANINDEASNDDTLGFAPYVEALAAFLTNPSTKGPLTVSIEGRWGSGKSSFMRQLEKQIRNAEGVLRSTAPALMVKFNAWRHDKEEALWAAFALDFMQQIRRQRGWGRRHLGDLKLFCLRYSWTTGTMDLIRVLTFSLCLLSVAAVVCYISVIFGPQFIHDTVKAAASSQDTVTQTILDWMFRVSGGLGCATVLAYLLTVVAKHVGNPITIDLRKHLKSPQYEGSVSFVEKFHHDFRKIVDAYAGGRRVYVFVDDLDRCQVPRAADLMQAITLMISGDPRLIFLIGMDWEMVVAGIAAKNVDLIRYLEAPATQQSRALQIGHEFVEKFIQLRFSLPRPGVNELRGFVRTLSNPAPPDSKIRLNDNRLFASKFSRFGLVLPWFSERIVAAEPEEEPVSPPTESRTLRELIEFGIGADSDTIQNVTLALASALENNPRRIKQFLGLYRLRTYLAKRTGLLAMSNDNTRAAITLEQLGKFTALELRWPMLVRHAAEDDGLLKRLEAAAVGLEEEKDEWIRTRGVRELFRVGLHPDSSPAISMDEWSLRGLDVHRLLSISPCVGAFEAKLAEPEIRELQRIISPANPTRSVRLNSPRVPFSGGQHADYAKEILPPQSKGFRLKIEKPAQVYWRCGFVLAPEDYIRPGRSDISITQYFLFHVSRGSSRASNQPDTLSFQVYRNNSTTGPQLFHSANPIEIEVSPGSDGLLHFAFGDQTYADKVDPSYFRYLYVVAWADSFGPFSVSAELTLF